ncbi:MAG TPA: Hsp20/alpha crystallin family protein [Bacillales bacterium]|nr:Hsp20/alpha crystallin family protein [Bacillales bacterium]
MDVDKLKQWLDTARQFQGTDFWSEIFDADERGGKQTRKRPDSTDKEMEAPLPPLELPLIDVYAKPDEWIVVVDLPGVAKEDVQLSASGNQLNIRGVARSTYHREASAVQTERLSGSFDRTVQLPEPVNETETVAVFRDGILEIRIRRADTSPRHTINID